jgi:hypothetical protein
VGRKDANATPDSVLALVQPTIAMMELGDAPGGGIAEMMPPQTFGMEEEVFGKLPVQKLQAGGIAGKFAQIQDLQGLFAPSEQQIRDAFAVQEPTFAQNLLAVGAPFVQGLLAPSQQGGGINAALSLASQAASKQIAQQRALEQQSRQKTAQALLNQQTTLGSSALRDALKLYGDDQTLQASLKKASLEAAAKAAQRANELKIANIGAKAKTDAAQEAAAAKIEAADIAAEGRVRAAELTSAPKPSNLKIALLERAELLQKDPNNPMIEFYNNQIKNLTAEKGLPEILKIENKIQELDPEKDAEQIATLKARQKKLTADRQSNLALLINEKANLDPSLPDYEERLALYDKVIAKEQTDPLAALTMSIQQERGTRLAVRAGEKFNEEKKQVQDLATNIGGIYDNLQKAERLADVAGAGPGGEIRNSIRNTLSTIIGIAPELEPFIRSVQDQFFTDEYLNESKSDFKTQRAAARALQATNAQLALAFTKYFPGNLNAEEVRIAKQAASGNLNFSAEDYRALQKLFAKTARQSRLMAKAFREVETQFIQDSQEDPNLDERELVKRKDIAIRKLKLQFEEEREGEASSVNLKEIGTSGANVQNYTPGPTTTEAVSAANRGFASLADRPNEYVRRIAAAVGGTGLTVEKQAENYLKTLNQLQTTGKIPSAAEFKQRMKQGEVRFNFDLLEQNGIDMKGVIRIITSGQSAM